MKVRKSQEDERERERAGRGTGEIPESIMLGTYH